MAQLNLQLACDETYSDELHQGSCSMQLMSAIRLFPKDALKEDVTEWLLSASLPFAKRLVWEGASGLVLPLMRLSPIGLRGEVASDKLQSVIQSFLEGLVKEGASTQLVSISKPSPKRLRRA